MGRELCRSTELPILHSVHLQPQFVRDIRVRFCCDQSGLVWVLPFALSPSLCVCMCLCLCVSHSRHVFSLINNVLDSPYPLPPFETDFGVNSELSLIQPRIFARDLYGRLLRWTKTLNINCMAKRFSRFWWEGMKNGCHYVPIQRGVLHHPTRSHDLRREQISMVLKPAVA